MWSAKNVKKVLEQSGIKYLYLPSYSPNLKPIEKLWSKMKVFLCKEKVGIVNEFPAAIQKAFSTISVSDCEGWFHASGYMHKFIGLL